ncbi:MAG: hypothetical protein J3R72DRAFT_202128 [Linnemannia gamsii]|nr:MAG: hypothetical protein J3R72DRAFT_202128 [Linnemannia gamsii]
MLSMPAWYHRAPAFFFDSFVSHNALVICIQLSGPFSIHDSRSSHFGGLRIFAPCVVRFPSHFATISSTLSYSFYLLLLSPPHTHTLSRSLSLSLFLFLSLFLSLSLSLSLSLYDTDYFLSIPFTFCSFAFSTSPRHPLNNPITKQQQDSANPFSPFNTKKITTHHCLLCHPSLSHLSFSHIHTFTLTTS